MNNDIELKPTPRARNGGAIRVECPLFDLAEITRGNLQEYLCQSVFRTGESSFIDGVEMVPVTFTARSDMDTSFLVHLTNFTDAHRTDISSAIMERIGDSPFYAATFLLPSDGIISYKIADVTGFPVDIGKERAGWIRVHEVGKRDIYNPNYILSADRKEVSVWIGPNASTASWPQEGLENWITVENEYKVSIYPGNGRILLLLDGQYWLPLNIAFGLRKFGYGYTVITIDSIKETRGQDMSIPDRISTVVKNALHLAGKKLNRKIPYADIIAGQSLGGLAVSNLAVHYPEIMKYGISQSASFWYPSSDINKEGELLSKLKRESYPLSVPLFIQIGSEEIDMITNARTFRDIYRKRGGMVKYTEYRGGHDFAWWRYGLIDALKQIENLLD